MMQTLYIIFTDLEGARLNQIMWDYYVIDARGNFKYPFAEGTTTYINVQQPYSVFDERMQDALNNAAIPQVDRDFLAALFANPKTYDEMVALGYIQNFYGN